MEWLKIDIDLAHHPKTRRLARLLGASVPQTIGYLFCLWAWAWRYATDGDLTNFDAVDIAEAAGYDGDHEPFYNSLIEAGFVDSDFNQVSLHDWIDYAGAFFKRREQMKDASKRYRERKQSSSRHDDVMMTQSSHDDDDMMTSCSRHDDAPMTDDDASSTSSLKSKRESKSKSESNKDLLKSFDPRDFKDLIISEKELTPPHPPIRKIDADDEPQETQEPEQPQKRKKGKGKEASCSIDYTPEFEAFFSVYPRQVSKADAFRVWKTRLREGALPKNMIAAAKNYAEMCRRAHRESEAIKHPATFIGPRRHWEEYVNGIPQEGKTTYQRAAESGPELGGVLGGIFGEMPEVIEAQTTEVTNGQTALETVCGTDPIDGRADDWEIPF